LRVTINRGGNGVDIGRRKIREKGRRLRKMGRRVPGRKNYSLSTSNNFVGKV